MSTSSLVKREMASQRRHFRISAPLHIRIKGSNATYSTKDWSVGGFRIQKYTGPDIAGRALEIEVLVTFADFNINFVTQASVVRTDPERQELAAAFTHLEKRHHELLKHFSDSIILGEMAPVRDTIQRIDLPVTLVSEKPDKPKGKVDPTPLKRKTVKTYTMSAAYICVGLFVGFYAINTIYANVFKLRVESAAIAGEDNLIKSPLSGTIDAMYIHPGQEVTRDDPLFYIRDEETLENIELAKLNVKTAKAELAETKQKLDSQISKMESYKLFGSDELQIANAKVGALRDKLNIAERRYQRLSKLNENNLYSDDLLDKISEDVIGLKADLKVALAERQIAKRAIEEIDKGRYFTDNRLEGEVDELRTAVTTAEEKVALEEEKLRIKESRRARLMITSPVDGKVSTVYSNQHQLIDKGEPILIVEGSGSKQVELLVSAKDFDHVNVDKPANVYLSGGGKSLPAYISRVDRNAVPESVALNDAEADANPKIKVRLSFSPEVGMETSSLPSGLPVTVVFSRQPLMSNVSTLSSIGSNFPMSKIADANR